MRSISQGNTPLHLAVTEQNQDVAQVLIEGNADINKLNKEKESPLDLADKELAKFMIAKK